MSEHPQFRKAEAIRDELPTFNAAEFFRDPIDVDFVEDFLGRNAGVTLDNIETSTALSIDTAGRATAANTGNFLDTVSRIDPRAGELQSERDDRILDFLAGRVPAEVSESTAQARAETGQITGVGATSGFSRNRLFRDFGINALDAIQFGVGAAQSALDQTFQVSANLTERPSQFFATQFGALQAGTVPSANQITQLSAAAEADNQNIAFRSAEQNLAIELDAFTLAFGLDASRRLARANEKNSLFKAAGALVGAGGALLAGGSFGGAGGDTGSPDFTPAGDINPDFDFRLDTAPSSTDLTLAGGDTSPGLGFPSAGDDGLFGFEGESFDSGFEGGIETDPFGDIGSGGIF